MAGSLQQYFDLYQFPMGRCLFAMRQVAELATELDAPQITQLAQQGVEQAQAATAVEAGWRRSRSTSTGKRVRASELDVQLDRTLGGMTMLLSGVAHTFGDDGPGLKATALLQRLFPEGAVAITSMNYENELAACEVILKDLNDGRRADAEALGLAPHIQRLEQLLPAFRDALKQETTREVSFDEVREARARAQEAMLHVVSKILGDYGGSEPASVETRQALLAPVMNQNRRIAEALSNRRPVGDVDPETGEEQLNPEPAPATP